MKRVRVLTEVSCYMKNVPGMLGLLLKNLAEKGVNIDGIQSYDGQLQSLVRLVVDKPDIAEEILRESGVDLISLPEVIEVLTTNQVGGLAKVTSVLGDHDINIISIYSTDGVDEKFGRSYIRVHDTEKAAKILEAELVDL
jgi:hypothetical protein